MAIRWLETASISVRHAAWDEGFDIDRYGDYSEEVRKTVKSKSINSLLRLLDGKWEDARSIIPKQDRGKISEVFESAKRGIYIISLEHGFSVSYPKGDSHVLYIGKGAIRSRLRLHLINSLFDFSRSLKDIEFKFYFCEPKKAGYSSYYHDLETDLLNKFKDAFGSTDLPYPLLNYNAGRNHDKEHEHGDGWSRPLANNGRKYKWAIKPTRHAGWPKKLRDPEGK
jgi:hypothetical protein